jgi:hypothetical protein
MTGSHAAPSTSPGPQEPKPASRKPEVLLPIIVAFGPFIVAFVVLSRHQAVVALLLLLALIAPVALSFFGWPRRFRRVAVVVSILLVGAALLFYFWPSSKPSQPVLPSYTFSLKNGATVGWCIPAVTGSGSQPPSGYQMALFDVELTDGNGPTTSEFSYDGLAQFTGQSWTIDSHVWIETNKRSSIGKHVKLIAFVVSNSYANMLPAILGGAGTWSISGPLPGTIPGTIRGSIWVVRGPAGKPCPL